MLRDVDAVGQRPRLPRQLRLPHDPHPADDGQRILGHRAHAGRARARDLDLLRGSQLADVGDEALDLLGRELLLERGHHRALLALADRLLDLGVGRGLLPGLVLEAADALLGEDGVRLALLAVAGGAALGEDLRRRPRRRRARERRGPRRETAAARATRATRRAVMRFLRGASILDRPVAPRQRGLAVALAPVAPGVRATPASSGPPRP